jgi:hypothetical protein
MASFIIALFTKCLRDQINECKKGGARSAYRRDNKQCNILVEKPDEKRTASETHEKIKG